MNNHPKSFEDCIQIIDVEIAKRKPRWNLSSLAWMDYDDVSQIVRLHVFKKWGQYDQTKPLVPWLNAIIGNQIKNLIRNHYSNFSRPCLKCAAAVDLGCKIYGEQCSACPLFGHWVKRKQAATQIKMPVSIENHPQEIREISDATVDISNQITNFHNRMREILRPQEFLVYESLFIFHEDESIVAKKLGYISNEKGRTPGYKQIKNIRKQIIIKAKKSLKEGDIDIF